MDRNLERPKPLSVMGLLYHQFQEQSSLCDITIKAGSWTKRFHWCALVTSPFFRAIYTSSFMEKQTGIVELNEWPASLVEESLLFLYGREPEVTESNVDALLDIAEFLLIQGLKRVCIDFLRRTKVTIHNCIHLLELSTVYGFELKDCERFILGNLPEVLEQEGMLNATTETVKMLLADPTLSYVPVQSWFNFLIRWVHRAPERQCSFVDLFRMLDFGGCDPAFITNIVAKEPLVTENQDDLEKLLTACKDNHSDTVIIFQFFRNSNNPMTCLNLRTQALHRVGIYTESVDTIQFEEDPIRGVKSSVRSCIYKVHKDYDYDKDFGSFSVLTHDLSNAQSSVSNIVVSDSGDDATVSDFYMFSLANHTLAAVFYDSKQKVTNANIEHSILYHGSNVRMLRASTLYIGTLGESVTEMHAVLTLQNHSISDVCCGDNGTIAMLTSDKDCLFIFDEHTGELECVWLQCRFLQTFKSCGPIHMAGFRDGFVLHDKERVVCVSKLREAVLGWKYLITTAFIWKKRDDPFCKVKHYFCGGQWYRYTYITERKGRFHGVSLEYVSHEDLTTAKDTTQLPWVQIPIPPQARRTEIPETIFAVSLPRGTLRCHMNCPHCKQIKDGMTSSDRWF